MMISLSLLRQLQSVGNHVIELLISLRRAELYSFTRTVDNTGIAADTPMMIYRALVLYCDVPARTHIPAYAAADTFFRAPFYNRYLKKFGEITLKMSNQQHQFFRQQSGTT